VLAIIAAVLFAIGFVIYVAAIATSAIFQPMALLLAGLVLLALQLAGIGPAWSVPRRRRR
jgi:hypothetical protein